MMTVSAACLFVANTFIIMAMRTGEIAVVAPFRYAMVPLSILLGYWCVGRHARCARLCSASAWSWRPASIPCIASGAA